MNIITKVIILVSYLFTSTTIKAQTLQWAKAIRGNSNELVYSIALDDSGNVYSTGNFMGTVDFDPGPGITNITATSHADVFVHKMDNSGNLLWVKVFGGGQYDTGQSIKVDDSGNVFTIGRYAGLVDFDPGIGTADFYSVGSSTDLFIQKLDGSGNFLWVKTFGGDSADYINAIDFDSAGNIYTVGAVSSIVDFDPGAGTFSYNASGNLDIFVQKLNNFGNFIWAKAYGGIWEDWGQTIRVDNSGNLFITGRYEKIVDFDPGATIAKCTTSGSSDFFVQKLDTSGSFHWVRSMGGIGTENTYSNYLDVLGNLYTIGNFRDSVDFDPQLPVANLYSVGRDDIFVQKLDSYGNLIWAKSYGGNGYDICISSCFDSSGNIYTTGTFEGTVDFDPGPGTANLTTTSSLQDVFVQKLDSAGNFIWAISFAGISAEWGTGISVDTFGNVYTAGAFKGTVDFDPGAGTTNLTALGSTDIYLLKMSPTITGMPELEDGIQITAYPNPGKGLVHLSFEKSLNNVVIVVTDLQGKIVFSKQQDVILNEIINIEGGPGVYFLNIKTLESQSVIKLVKE